MLFLLCLYESVIFPLEFSVDDITRSLKSFKNGLSGGPDGLTPQHLKDLTSEALGKTSRNVLQALVMFTNCTWWKYSICSVLKPFKG